MPQLPGEMDGWRGALNIAGSQNVSEALPRRGGERDPGEAERLVNCLSWL